VLSNELKFVVLAFALCGLWFVAVTVKDVWVKVWPKIKTWWAGEKSIVTSEFDAIKARLAALEAKLP
jgi:hypothetical protein